jgi:hypothetical protein
MCDELKLSMQKAIDQFNVAIDTNTSMEHAEDNVKKIAHMFKLIDM